MVQLHTLRILLQRMEQFSSQKIQVIWQIPFEHAKRDGTQITYGMTLL